MKVFIWDSGRRVPCAEPSGSIGRLLGELLGLPEENDVTVYLELFRNIFTSENGWNAAWEQEIIQLLRSWPTLEINLRAQISTGLQETWRSAGLTGYPVLIINKPSL